MLLRTARGAASGREVREPFTAAGSRVPFLKGFTLVELLVVVVLLGIVVSAIAASLGAGIRAWDAAQRVGLRESDAALAFGIVERDVANAVPLPPPADFAGREDGLVLAMPRWDSGAGAWELVGVKYDFSDGCLWRSEWRLSDEKRPPAGGERLLSGLRRVRWDYWRSGGQEGQSGSWVSEATSLPVRVRIRVTADDGHLGEWDISRTIRLPAALP